MCQMKQEDKIQMQEQASNWIPQINFNMYANYNIKQHKRIYFAIGALRSVQRLIHWHSRPEKIPSNRLLKQSTAVPLFFSLKLFLLAALVVLAPIKPCSAADSIGVCYVTVNVTPGPELAPGWSYQLSYRDTDNRWYFGASGTYGGTFYKQAPDWLNESISWRCQLQFNSTNYGSPQEALCVAGSSTVSFKVLFPVFTCATSSSITFSSSIPTR